MESGKIRQELHELIDHADERMINLMYALIHADMTEADYELTDLHKRILDERIASHRTNPTSGSEWADSKARIKNQL